MSPWLELFAERFPSPDEGDLLRACLAPPEAARRALARWLAGGPPEARLEAAGGALRRLLPLLATRIPPAEAGVLRPLLSAAALKEELRAARVQAVADALHAAFDEAGLPALVSNGLGLVGTLYRPRARHVHDLDLLLAPEDLPAALALCARHGWRRTGAGRLVHRSGLPLCLHSRLHPAPLPAPPFAELFRRAPGWPDRGIRRLAPADLLARIALRGLCSPGLHRLSWLCDAARLLAPDPALLEALPPELRAPVRLALTPLVALGLRALPDSTLDRAATELLSHAAWSGRPLHFPPGPLWRPLLRWALWPSGDYVRRLFPTRRWPLPALRVWRVLARARPLLRPG